MKETSRDHLKFAFKRVLRPLIRILVRSGVRYDEFLELVREVYVETAVKDGLGDGVQPTRARVSLSTGVPRRDVDRFIDSEGASTTAVKSFTRTLQEVLHKWHTDPQFVGPYGIPLELEMTAPRGKSLRDLVAAVNITASPGDVLEELVRLRAVVVSGDSHFRTVSRVLIPLDEMSVSQLELFGNALTRLADTLQFNMDHRNAAKRLEQAVVSDRGLPRAVVPIFERYVRERVGELLIEIDNWLSPYSAEEAGEPKERIGLAVFQFVDRDADTSPMKDCVRADPS
jgi:hypothetical protein